MSAWSLSTILSAACSPGPGPGEKWSSGTKLPGNIGYVESVSNDGFVLVVAVPSDIDLEDLSALGCALLVSAPAPGFALRCKICTKDSYVKGIVEFGGTLVLPRLWLRPVDTANEYVIVRVEMAAFAVSSQGLWSQDPLSLSFGPAYVAGTQVQVSCNGASIVLGEPAIPPAPALKSGFQGLYLQSCTLTFPPDLQGLLPETATLKNATIGTGGFSGSLYVDYGNAKPEYKDGTYTGKAGVGSLFGMAFAVDKIDLNIQQNAFVSNSITGTMRLPFFDVDASVTVGLTSDGGYLLKYNPKAADSAFTTAFAKVTIDSFGIAGKGTEARLMVSGTITPTVAEGVIDWPTMVVKNLSVDRHGNVDFAGGWVDLPKPRSTVLAALPFEISKMGMGQDPDGCPWYGLNRALKLPDGVPASASVEGLKVRPTKVGAEWDWKQPRIEFSGIGVEFEIPEVLHFKGHVSYRDDGITKDFRGGVTVDLFALDMTIEGTVVFGSAQVPKSDSTTPFFALYLSADLPTPIPLFGSNLAVYGVSGLAAVNYAPDRKADEPWYAMDHNDWYHKGKLGIADLYGKWTPTPGAFAIGLGADLATANDNGYTFNGKFLAVVTLPGPVILLEGAADVLRERPVKHKNGDPKAKPAPKPPEPAFHALAVLDGNAGQFTVGLDAVWRYQDAGQLVDIAGSAELLIDFGSPLNSHLWVGKKTPEAARVRAKILSLFDANAYLMVDAKGVRFGAKAGWSKHWSYTIKGFGIEVGANIQQSSDVDISWNPPQFQGQSAMSGAAYIKICGEGLSVSVAASLVVDVPQPFRVAGDLAVACEVWPFGTFGKTIHLEWTSAPGLPPPVDPQTKVPLPSPPVLALTNVSIRHGLTGEVWPLVAGQSLLPAGLADARGFLVKPLPDAQVPETKLAPADGGPVVPLDAQIDLSFARPVADECKVGIGAQEVLAQVVGDADSGDVSDKLGYTLSAVRLERWTGEKWELEAQRPWKAGDEGLPLWGAWAADAGAGAEFVNRRLHLWGVDPAVVAAPTPLVQLDGAERDLASQGQPWAAGTLLVAPIHVLRSDSRWHLKVETRVDQTFLPPPAAGAGTPSILTVVQHGYFRTEGGPGQAALSLPPGALPSEVLTDEDGNPVDLAGAATTTPVKRSPLLGLAPYVWRPIPAAPQLKHGPKSVWRSAEIGVDFAATDLAQLYRGRGQDLAVRLVDRAGIRLKTAQGRPWFGRSRWLPPAALWPNDSATAAKVTELLAKLNAGGANLKESDLASSARLRGPQLLLPADTDATVQVVPALLAQVFDSPIGGLPGGWLAVDSGNAGGKSQWAVAAVPGKPAELRQLAALGTIQLALGVAARPGSSLVWGQAGNSADKWRNLALMLRFRAGDTGAVGVEWRRADGHNLYRLVLDNDLARWRVLQITNGTAVLLAESPASLDGAAWHDLQVLTVGSRIEVTVDGQVAFDLTQPNPPTQGGTVALFAAGTGSTAFADLWVEDLSPTVRPVWQGSLTTERFASPRHLASFAPSEARRPPASLPALSGATAAELKKALALVVDAKSSALSQPSLQEDRAAQAVLAILAEHWPDLKAPPEGLDIVRFDLPDLPPLWLLRSQVHLDWQRSALSLWKLAEGQAFPRVAAGAVQIAGATWPANSEAGLQSVDLIAREACDLTGVQLVAEAFAGPDVGPGPALPLVDAVARPDAPAGLLYAEDFATFALQRWRPGAGSQAAWVIANGQLTGSAAFGGEAVIVQPAAVATDLHAAFEFTAEKGCCGVVVRRGPAGNHYRLVWDADTLQMRLEDVAGPGQATVLSAASLPTLVPGSLHVGEFWCVAGQCLALIDGRVAVSASTLGQRGNGFGLWMGVGGRIRLSRLAIETWTAPLLSFGPLSTETADWPAQDGAWPAVVASQWLVAPAKSAVPGAVAVSQTAELPGSGPSGIGGSAVTLPCGSLLAYQWLVRLKFSSAGRAGLGFGQGVGAWVLECRESGWQVRRHAAAAAEPPLAQAPTPLAAGAWHSVCVRALDGRLSVWLDGTAIVDQALSADLAGPLSLLSLQGPCSFEHVVLLDPRPTLGAWRQVATAAAPGPWPAALPWVAGAWFQDRLGLTLGRPTACLSANTGRSLLLAQGQELADAHLTAVVRPGAAPFGLVFRWRSTHDHRLAWVTTDEIQVFRVVGGTTIPLGKPLAHGVATLRRDLELRLSVEASAGTFTVGGKSLGFVDDDPRPGLWGVAADPTSHCSVERLELTPVHAQPASLMTLEQGSAAWTVCDAPGANASPSQWNFDKDFSIRQSSGLWAGPGTPEDLARPGAVLLRNSASPLTDFLLSCDLCGGTELDEADTLGVVFRWRGPGVFYRFSMDYQTAHRRLVKVVNGVATLLWGDQVAYTLDQWYRLVISAQGEHVRGWLDGVPLFAVRDATIDSGQVGLYTWAHTNAHFRRFQVQALRPQDAALLLTKSLMDGADSAVGLTGGTGAWTWTAGGLKAAGSAVCTAEIGGTQGTDYRCSVMFWRGQAVGDVGMAVGCGAAERLCIRLTAAQKLLVTRQTKAAAPQGVWTDAGELACVAAQVPLEQWRMLTVDFAQGYLAVWLSGQLLCRVQSPPLAGGAALLSLDAKGSIFRHVCVERLRERRLARWNLTAQAGDEWRIVPADEQKAGEPTSGTPVKKLQGAPAEAWPANGPVRLSLLRREGVALHHAWAAAPAGPPLFAPSHLLRTADGRTVIVIGGPTKPEVGPHQLVWTWRAAVGNGNGPQPLMPLAGVEAECSIKIPL
jgi:hypothetical protein